MSGLKGVMTKKLFGKKLSDSSGFQRQADGSALVNGKKYPKGTQEDNPNLPKMSPTSGKPMPKDSLPKGIAIGNPKKVKMKR